MKSSATPHDDHDAEDRLEHLLLHDHRWAWRVALLLWTLAGSLFVAMAIPSVRDALDGFDRAIYDATYPIKWAPLTGLAFTLAFLGSAPVLWPLRIGVGVVLGLRRRWTSLWTWLLAIAISDPLIGILKAAYGRARPEISLVTETTGSFPSGHATAGAVFAVSLVIVFVRAGPARRNLEMVAAVFALVMAGSRMYLGAHWFTDVLAGIAFGAACAVGAAAIVQRLRQGPSTEASVDTSSDSTAGGP